jgi:hypothetical protein
MISDEPHDDPALLEALTQELGAGSPDGPHQESVTTPYAVGEAGAGPAPESTTRPFVRAGEGATRPLEQTTARTAT